MTVVPLFCALFIRGPHHHPPQGAEMDAAEDASAEIEAATGRTTPPPSTEDPPRWATFGERFNSWFNRGFEGMLNGYDRAIGRVLAAPGTTVAILLGTFVVSLALFPLLGLSFFPRTDAGQFVINLKAPSGTRLEFTEDLIGKVESVVRQVVRPDDLGMVVSNIGSTPDFSAIYTSNSAQHTAFVQVSLKEGHKTGSYEYMKLVRRRLEQDLPQLNSFFQSGGLVDAVLNLGLPAPIDVQVSGSNMKNSFSAAAELARNIREMPGVSGVFIPQDLDSPALQLDVDRTRASELGLSQREVVGNVITALTSNQMIAPSFWIDPKTGNDYMLTVQYPETQIKSMSDLKSIPIRSAAEKFPARLDAISKVSRIESPTEVDHYQLRRTIDIYVSPLEEDLGQLAGAIDNLIARTKVPDGVRVDLRGMVQGMRASFHSFSIGLILALVLLYLILVAQFRSFVDPFLILLAVPSGLSGVLLTLWATGTTLNVMSLMGVVMLVGIVVSNSILIVEFTHRLREEGMGVRDAVARACRVRLRPVLMTSLATIIGLLPMAAKLGAGSESYAPLARAIIGGLSLSVILTVFIVPAAYLLVYRRQEAR
jgi:multidrug efflux pump subunit AcrB